MPQSQYPAILAGQDATAGLLQALAPLEAWKASAATRTGNTLSIDPDLQVTLAANATYKVTASLLYSVPSAGHFEFTWTVPSGATGGFVASLNVGGTGVTVNGYTWGATVTTSFTSSSNYGVLITGVLVTSSGGTFGVQWNNDTSSDQATLGVGSLLEARRIA
jgi:hypothetical protein